MPTYEYLCNDCTTTFEIVQKFSDAALTTCPECDGSLRKVFSPVGVVFKGSGFYATDNRTKGKAAAATAGAGTTGAGTGHDGKSHEHKSHESKSHEGKSHDGKAREPKSRDAKAPAAASSAA